MNRCIVPRTGSRRSPKAEPRRPGAEIATGRRPSSSPGRRSRRTGGRSLLRASAARLGSPDFGARIPGGIARVSGYQDNARASRKETRDEAPQDFGNSRGYDGIVRSDRQGRDDHRIVQGNRQGHRRADGRARRQGRDLLAQGRALRRGRRGASTPSTARARPSPSRPTSPPRKTCSGWSTRPTPPSARSTSWSATPPPIPMRGRWRASPTSSSKRSSTTTCWPITG
jgi:hypothetical protein